LHIKEKWSDVVAGRSIGKRNEDSTSKQYFESNITSCATEEPWKTVSRGYRKPSSVNHASYYQIPIIINRYEQLRNEGKYEEMVRDSRNTQELEARNEGRDKVQKITNKQMEKKHKVIVIGDSHARGCAAEIKSNLEEDIEVQGFISPGTRVNTVTTSAIRDIQQLSKQDVVVVWGGLKDVGKNESKKGINRIQRFVETNKHTNIILMEVPHRHDLKQESCVNKEVKKYNSRIRKHMKVHENAEVLHVNLDRSGFTKHGLHMNTMGKELMAKRIVEAIKRTLKVWRKKPVSLKWKEGLSRENQGPGEATNEVGEERDPTENQNDSVQAEDNNSKRQEKETGESFRKESEDTCNKKR